MSLPGSNNKKERRAGDVVRRVMLMVNCVESKLAEGEKDAGC